MPQGPYQGVLLSSLDPNLLALTEGSLGLGAAVLLPLEAVSQVAEPLPAIRPLAVDVVVV